MKRSTALALAALAFALITTAPASAQNARVVAVCGTLPTNYTAGSTGLATVDPEGLTCGAATVTGGGDASAANQTSQITQETAAAVSLALIDNMLAPITPATATATNSVLLGGEYRSTLPTWTNSQQGALQLTNRGALNTALYDVNGNSISSGNFTADGSPTSDVGIAVIPRQLIFNGTTFDRQRSVINATNATGTGIAAAGLVAQADDTSPQAITENQFGNLRLNPADHALHVAKVPYPSSETPETATSGLVSNASAVATLATASSRTTYITGFQCTPGSATAAAAVSIVISGLITGSNTMTAYATNATTFVPAPIPIIVKYDPPVPASGTNVTIVVTMGAVGTGGTTAVCNAQGFLL